MNLNIGNIGVWGFRHYEYLKRNKPMRVNVMRMNGTLEDYLKQVNRDALEMQEMLIKQYAKAEGVTEALKASNQMEWVCRTENIRDRVNEVVLNDLIYQYFFCGNMDSRRGKTSRLDQLYGLIITIVWEFAVNKSQLFGF